jgi:Carboxypeptidase regulatory-like domain
MSDAGTIEGIVVDGDGRPLALATIVVVKGTSPVPEIALVADDDGRFGLRLPHGRFTLEAQGEGGAKGHATIEVAGASLKTRIEVK